jgi:hypothetical protein
MLYNDNIAYNSEAVIYSGELVLNIQGIHSPIIIPQATVIFGSVPDYSNSTQVGYVTYDYTPTGILTIQVSGTQAEAISQSGMIYIQPVGEMIPQEISSEDLTTSQTLVSSSNYSGEIYISGS